MIKFLRYYLFYIVSFGVLAVVAAITDAFHPLTEPYGDVLALGALLAFVPVACFFGARFSGIFKASPEQAVQIDGVSTESCHAHADVIITETTFRHLLIGCLLSIIIGFVMLLLFEPLLPDELASYVKRTNEEPFRAFDLLAFPVLLLDLWAFVALYRFKPYARKFALWVTVVDLAYTPVLGPQITTGWDNTFSSLAALLWGAALAAAYYSPISERFRAGSSTIDCMATPVGDVLLQ